MPGTPTIASGAIQKLLAGVALLDLDPAEICRAAGTTPDVAADADVRVPLATLHALWEAIQARRPRAQMALETARFYAPGDYGLVGFACASAATFGDALAQIARYARLWTDAPSMIVDGATVELRYRPPLADRPGLRLATEAALAELVHGARAVTRRPDLAPCAVDVGHPAPADLAPYRAFFGVAPRFGAERTAVAFAPGLVGDALPGADPALAGLLRGLADAALARSGGADDLLERVRTCLAEALPVGVPGLRAIARRLGTSERTLRRRLGAEGTGFRELLDTTRAELARAYTRDPRLPLSEVAFLLGYAEQSAFHRAFKRWTGQTPAAFRGKP
jgi:AraC-like DNA-binding protein